MNNLTFLVHPPLALHLHPLCKDVIERFQQCHQENQVGKFFGACNDLRTELDKCLYEEYLQSKQKNLEDARKQRAKYDQMKKERPFPSQATSSSESGDNEAKN
eukprot:TRINITY_DN15154_c0_g1_i1.p1 TRINITY_DN15154_c0_g1~~TRINITY_DN15154_c0_g1_i1.p1  ORF type:complete len:111 (+),score=24.11 TRINITY_DN15154_c0_g1_i1:25-333(+)